MARFEHNGVVYEELPNGKVRPVAYANPLAGATPVGGPDPMKPLQVQGAQIGLQKDAADLNMVPLEREGKGLNNQQTAQQIRTQRFTTLTDLKKQFDADERVKTYKGIIPKIAGAMSAPDTAAGDMSVIYAFAQVMDPNSAVRGEELDMAQKTSPLMGQIQSMIGMVNQGKRLPPETRRNLVDAIRSRGHEYKVSYEAARDEFGGLAKQGNYNPHDVIGDPAGAKYRDVEMRYLEAGKKSASPDGTSAAMRDPQMSSQVDAMIDAGVPLTAINAALQQQHYPPLVANDYDKAIQWKKQNPGKRYYGAQIPQPSTYEASALGQGLSGVNEGIASVLGAPVDLTTAAINAGTSGINALANTQIPQIKNPFLGSDQIKSGMQSIGSIFEPTPDSGGMFARRVGQSVGAAAVPLGAATTPARMIPQLLMGLGGGIGGATAQQAFPGNPIAEMGGELLGGGATAGGLTRGLKHLGQREIEAGVPTVDQLKEQAGQLYRAAESRGVVADPTMTQGLNDDIRKALADEGRLSPTGRITEAYPKAKEAVQLIGDYAGKDMTPSQMQSVRKVVGDGLSSPEPAERRLSGVLTDIFDNFANPLAPELKDARDISSRYLTAQQLEKARELAGARASQFTGSGFENALRTEYRGLDRAAIKGNARFSNDVTDAIEKVGRGTPTSNLLRGLGRLAPTGPVSGMASMMSGVGAGALTNPTIGAMVGGTLAGAGMFGRAGATRMGIRAADQAELIARNGGKLPEPVISPEWLDMMRRLGVAESAKYLPK